MNVLASWDNGTKSDLKMANLMDKYNINTTFYWPSIIINQNKSVNLSTEECKEIASRFTIGSRSATNQSMKKMNIAQIGMEVTDSRKQLQDFTGQSIDSFSYPKNSINSMTRAIINGAGYTSARTSIVGSLSPGNDPYQMECTVQIGIDRIEYSELSWELFSEKLIEKCSDSSIFHIFGDSQDVEKFNDWEALETLIKKIIN